MPNDQRMVVFQKIYELTNHNLVRKISVKQIHQELSNIPEIDIDGWIEYYSQLGWLTVDSKKESVYIKANGIDGYEKIMKI